MPMLDPADCLLCHPYVAIRPVTPSMLSALAMEPKEETSQPYALHRMLFLASFWHWIGSPRAWIEQKAGRLGEIGSCIEIQGIVR